GGGGVLKPRQGQEGIGVEVIFPKTKDELRVRLEGKLIHGQFIIEDKIVQHPDIDAIYSKSVNTIRVITIRSDQVRVVRAAMRFGNGKSVDNVSGGGIAAPVDIKTGLIYDGAISKYSSNRLYEHPISCKAIKGFTIPFWDKVLELVCEAAESISEQKSIGWDIAVTSEGPVIVEVNSGWCRVLAQAPHQQGIMPFIASEVDDEVLNPIHRKMKKIWKQQ
ncbi:MAG: sugar-transfer associated ATP-grasp domain-containing protein, partial [Candidatus Cloacimonetes bacterium]|nr:sugar-transfer associated ATP-grasp domain-containing protein [Candidatus Cloacimonadota bacterium]